MEYCTCCVRISEAALLGLEQAGYDHFTIRTSVNVSTMLKSKESINKRGMSCAKLRAISLCLIWCQVY